MNARGLGIRDELVIGYGIGNGEHRYGRNVEEGVKGRASRQDSRRIFERIGITSRPTRRPSLQPWLEQSTLR